MHRPHALHRFVVGLLSRTWLCAAITAGVCALFAAKAWAAWNEPAPVFTDVPAAAKPPPPHVSHDKRGEQLVARNLFCSDCAPEIASADDGPGFTTDAVLIATAVDERGRDSSATVRVPASEMQGSWAIGETIPGVGTISDIRFTYIDLVDASARHGRLSLKAAPKDENPPPQAAKPASPYADRIHKLSDNSYDVDRSLVRDLVGGSAGGGGGIRAQPLLDKDGGIRGVKILGARPDSVAAAIGLHSGDILVGVDGEPIKTAQQMLNLYAKLDQKDRVTLSGTRGGKDFSIDLHLR
ncbi:MAG TPA: PDZ domain-containing protein [Kofleriaceae bacterium]|jgi:hypothetical protein